MTSLHTVSAADFEAACGFAPKDDDLERVNCPRAGEIGHSHCGWCLLDDKPRFICGHRHRSDDLVSKNTGKEA